MKSPFLTSSLCWLSALALNSCAIKDSTSRESKERIQAHPHASGHPHHPHKVVRLRLKTYDDQSIAVKEIKKFYLLLIESDSTVKSQFDLLAKESREANGGIFKVLEPEVVSWMPSEESWSAPVEFHTDTRYLLIHPIGYGRGHHSGTDAVIVSEFHVVDTEDAIQADQQNNADKDRMSTTMTITFLGFRNFQISPINHQK